MNIPMQITYRDMEASDSLDSEIRKRASELEKFFDHIIRCRVIVEAPSAHHRNGQSYQVRIELSVPGQEIIAGEHDSNEDAYVAVRDAFARAERELKKYAERRIEHQQGRHHSRRAVPV